MDEFALIDAIRARLPGEAEGVQIGIGDDAAVVRDREHDQVLTVDVAVEGVHFRRDLLSLRDAGRRAFMAAASDVAAMGAAPRVALLALILPSTLPDSAVLELVDGIADGARELGVAVVGGNVSGGGELSITTTVAGALDGPPLRREGARVGDGVYVTGVPGAAALGLALLQAGGPLDLEAEPFVVAWRRPTAAVATGLRLRSVASAAIDVSDGLLQDLGHLCAASRVGARLEVSALPLPATFEALASRIGRSPFELALTGGEDYSLLFTAGGPDVPPDLGATRIGAITRGSQVEVIDAAGEPLELAARGFLHRTDGGA